MSIPEHLSEPFPAPPAEGTISCSVQGAVVLIGINRPAKRNGFTPTMLRELGQAYTRLDDDPALRVGVLHALGEHFTAGLDLPSFAPLMRSGENAVSWGWWTCWTSACRVTGAAANRCWWRSRASPIRWASN